MPTVHMSLSRATFLATAVAATALLFLALVPEAADAALKRAAGGGGGGGGFRVVTNYLDRLAGFLIPVGAGLAVLGIIYGGALFMTGNPTAGKILGYVAVGVVIVLASKGLAA
ncbi:MAG: hypothetical protein WKF96_15235 [Solirubrobacteraceae bacterium]